MFRILIPLLIMVVSLAAQAWVRVGNGGEGVRINGELYIRDLYEVGTHLNPYVEDFISEEVLERWRRSSHKTLFQDQEEILVKKLTELDGFFPGFAEIFIAGLERYRFVFVDKELPLMPDDSNTVPEQWRVSIALRQYSEIVIHRQQWNSLSVVSQTALLIHEIFYALSQVHCQEADRCSQYSHTIRPLVGRLFQKVKADDFAHSLITQLSLANVHAYCETKPLRVELNVIASANVGRSSLARHSAEFLPSVSGFRDFATKACKFLEGELEAESLVYTFQHEYLSLGKKIYGTRLRAESGQMDAQLALVFRRLDRVIRKNLRKTSENGCVQKLSSELRNFAALVRKEELPFDRVCVKKVDSPN